MFITSINCFVDSVISQRYSGLYHSLLDLVLTPNQFLLVILGSLMYFDKTRIEDILVHLYFTCYLHCDLVQNAMQLLERLVLRTLTLLFFLPMM